MWTAVPPSLLFKLSITLENGRDEVLAVFHGDDPLMVAQRFAAIHNLPATAVSQLRDSIVANMGIDAPAATESRETFYGIPQEVAQVSPRERWVPAGPVHASSFTRSPSAASSRGRAPVYSQPLVPSGPDPVPWQRSLRSPKRVQGTQRHATPQRRVAHSPTPTPGRSPSIGRRYPQPTLAQSVFDASAAEDSGPAVLRAPTASSNWTSGRGRSVPVVIPQRRSVTPTSHRVAPVRVDSSLAFLAPRGTNTVAAFADSLRSDFHKRPVTPSRRQQQRYQHHQQQRQQAWGTVPPETPRGFDHSFSSAASCYEPRPLSRPSSTSTAYMKSLAAAARSHSAAAKAAHAAAQVRACYPTHAPPVPGNTVMLSSAQPQPGAFAGHCVPQYDSDDANPVENPVYSPTQREVSAAEFLSRDGFGMLKDQRAEYVTAPYGREHGVSSYSAENRYPEDLKYVPKPVRGRRNSDTSNEGFARPMTLEEVAATRMTPTPTSVGTADPAPVQQPRDQDPDGSCVIPSRLQALIDRKRELVSGFRQELARSTSPAS
jgi:hypothetical protein